MKEYAVCANVEPKMDPERRSYQSSDGKSKVEYKYSVRDTRKADDMYCKTVHFETSQYELMKENSGEGKE